VTGRAVQPLPRFLARRRIGFVLAVLGGFWVVVGSMMAFFPSEKVPAATGWLNAAMAAALLFLPGLYLWLTARAIEARNDRIERVAALASVQGRMPLGDAASTLGVGVGEARVLLLDAVAAGLVDGRIDAEKNVFLVSTGVAPVSTLDVVCGSCGGRSTVSVRAGETPKCGYCGGASAPAAP
jgi:hypothetical protein